MRCASSYHRKLCRFLRDKHLGVASLSTCLASSRPRHPIPTESRCNLPTVFVISKWLTLWSPPKIDPSLELCWIIGIPTHGLQTWHSMYAFEPQQSQLKHTPGLNLAPLACIHARLFKLVKSKDRRRPRLFSRPSWPSVHRPIPNWPRQARRVKGRCGHPAQAAQMRSLRSCTSFKAWHRFHGAHGAHEPKAFSSSIVGKWVKGDGTYSLSGRRTTKLQRKSCYLLSPNCKGPFQVAKLEGTYPVKP